MLKADIYRDSSGQVLGFQISGHAGYGEHGSDIVCSAVSVLALNTVNSIERFTQDVPEVSAINEEEGFLHYRLKSASKEAELLLDSLVLGLTGIAGSYSDYIRIEFKEV